MENVKSFFFFSSEAEEEQIPPPLTPAPCKQSQLKRPSEKPIQSKPMPTIIPSFTIPAVQPQNQTNGTNRPGTMPSIPLPLLILNSLQPQQQQNNSQEKKDVVSSSNGNNGNKIGNGR